MSLKKNLGEKIREYRLVRGYTQKELARLANITPTTLGLFERGISYPTERNLEKIITALDVEPHQLFEFKKKRKSNPLSPQDIKKLFGRRLKQLRKGLGVTQPELAEKVGIKRYVISKSEMGENFPSVDNLERIMRVLNISLNQLLDPSYEPYFWKEGELRILLGRKIKILREEFGVSQGEFSKATNMSKGTLSLIEQGISFPTTSSLSKILEVFNIPPAELFDFHDFI